MERHNRLLSAMDISIIHQYGSGKYRLQDLPSFFGRSQYGDYLCEGIYIRWDEEGYLKKRAKLVRYDFKQDIVLHWRRKELQTNRLLIDSYF